MKKKILHVSCGGLGHGGVSAVIFSIVETLYNQFDFDCVVFKKHCDREKDFQRYGKLIRIKAYNDDGRRHLFELLLRPWIMYWGIYKNCKKNKYQVIHCHNNRDEGICLLAAKHAGVPIRIAHSHNTLSPKQQGIITKASTYFNRKLMIYASTDRIGCSEEACNSFFGETEHKVIFNAIDLNKYKAYNRTSHNKLIFIHVGRYTYQKNQEMVIQVFYRINQMIPDSELLLVGFGEDKDKLEKEITALNLNDVVKLVPGNKVDVGKLYATSDYMIFPSVYEGFGIVLLEAQAMGIPCFVSEAIQKEADVGLLTYIELNKGPEVWAQTILNYIENNKTVDEDDVKKKLYQYSSEVIGNQYIAIYKG